MTSVRDAETYAGQLDACWALEDRLVVWAGRASSGGLTAGELALLTGVFDERLHDALERLVALGRLMRELEPALGLDIYRAAGDGRRDDGHGGRW